MSIAAPQQSALLLDCGYVDLQKQNYKALYLQGRMQMHHRSQSTKALPVKNRMSVCQRAAWKGHSKMENEYYLPPEINAVLKTCYQDNQMPGNLRLLLHKHVPKDVVANESTDKQKSPRTEWL